MEQKGFDELYKVCGDLGLHREVTQPLAQIPDATDQLGVHLDQDLITLYEHTNGARLWDVFVFGAHESSNNIFEINQTFRSISQDVFPSLDGLLIYAQIGYQETYLATVSCQDSHSGRYPVVYVDLNEEAIFLPLASSVDSGFVFIARYLIFLAEEYGSVAAGLEEVIFPWDVPQLVINDKDFSRCLRERCFGEYVSEDNSTVKEWLSDVMKYGGLD